jgi:hypothetical protein
MYGRQTQEDDIITSDRGKAQYNTGTEFTTAICLWKIKKEYPIKIIKANSLERQGGFLDCGLGHSGRCAASCEAYTNFADESAYLTADNFGMKGTN